MSDRLEQEARRVLIPRDPVKRAALAQMAGLTAEERQAIEQWCFDTEAEERRKRGTDGIHLDSMAQPAGPIPKEPADDEAR